MSDTRKKILDWLIVCIGVEKGFINDSPFIIDGIERVTLIKDEYMKTSVSAMDVEMYQEQGETLVYDYLKQYFC